MRIEPGKAYTNLRGDVVLIMGPARRDDQYADAFWSLGGDHYLPDGRKLGYRLVGGLFEPNRPGESYVCAGGHLLREVPTPAIHADLMAEAAATWAARSGDRGRPL